MERDPAVDDRRILVEAEQAVAIETTDRAALAFDEAHGVIPLVTAAGQRPGEARVEADAEGHRTIAGVADRRGHAERGVLDLVKKL